jgi:hypothetical protein
MVVFFLVPAVTLAATSTAPARAPNAKSVSLKLADVLHVLGSGLTAGNARYSKPNAMGACTSTPPLTEYTANFYGPLHTKGVLGVISMVYTYRSAAGPLCNQKLDISMNKVLGGTIGKMTTVHGVGEQAFLLDTTGPKSQRRPVFTLALKFIRGSYRAIIVVQSNQTIKGADVIRLGKIVDGRMKKTG